MKKAIPILCCVAAASLGLAQQTPPVGYFDTIPVTGPPIGNASFQPLTTAVPLPMFTYNVTASPALGGGSYSGKILGRSPFDRGKTTTTIPTQIIPLIITINNGAGDNITYDPTLPDGCAGGRTDLSIITGSPIFTNTTSWNMNTVNVGTTQYIDAFQRAQFWSLVAGSGYHLILNESTLTSQSMSFGSSGTQGPGTNYNAATLFGGCGNIGVVRENDLNAAVQAIITGPLAASINVGTFPIFLTKNVVMATSGTSIFSNCCVLGFHSGFTVGSNIQIYSPFSLDTTGTFGGDVSTLAHEMGEAINDPTTNNLTPVWGKQGQQSGCQGNFEVGDPLSPGGIAPTSNEFVVAGGNGFTYHLQELAFFSWFYGAPSIGANGWFSNNSTFKGSARLCSAGGGTF